MSLVTLRARLGEAGLTVEEFADIVGVDPKTVQRWLDGRTPYRRHRATIARALDTSEHELWPDSIPAGDPANVSQETRSRGDVVASWGTADEDTAPDPGELLVADAGPVDVLDPGRRLLVDDRLIAALIEAAGESSLVRVLVDLPGRELVPLIGVAHVELRVIDDATGPGLLRAGGRMLAFLDLPGALDQARPLLELRATSEAGLFARYLDHVNDLWDQADETVESDEQLEAYLLLEPDDDDPLGPLPAPPAKPTDVGDPPAGERADAPRRWPRRPA